MSRNYLAELEAEAARMKSTGFLCEMEVFNTDEGGMLEIMRTSGGAAGLPNLMKAMGFGYSIKDNGRVRKAFSDYLIARGLKAEWSSAMGRIYFASEEDAVMAYCLA